jgi:hypothetical protein
MIKHLFQSIGIVFSLMLLTVVTMGTLYLTYVLGIGILLIALVFIVYTILKSIP